MTIVIKYQPTEYVLEDWLFICRHPETHTEEADFGYPDARIGDYVDDWRNIEVCDECNVEVGDN